MMNLITAALAIAVAAMSAQAAAPQNPSGQAQKRPPDFKVQIWGDAIADFVIRVQAYSDLRKGLERGLPVLRVTDDARELLTREHALAERIRAARSRARQGDILTPGVSEAFKEMLRLQASPSTCAALGDDNPGALEVGTNDRYPEHKPMSTMPANVLAALPRLAEDVEYRLLGRDLILVDTRARLVLDRMPLAILCSKPR